MGTYLETAPKGVEFLESLPIGAISFDIKSQNDCTPVLYSSLTKWWKHYPYWDQPGIYLQKAIGDCYVMKTETTLTLAQPYPGDECYNMMYVCPELCFDVVQHTNQRQYMIHDRATYFSISIPKSHLANPKFDIS